MIDLAQRVAELFSEKHKLDARPRPPMYPRHRFCHTCNVWVNVKDCDKHGIPDPIDITDLGKALECFREIFPDVRYKQLNKDCDPVMPKNWRIRGNTANPLLTLNWLLFKATPAQIWEICCLAKEKELDK